MINFIVFYFTMLVIGSIFCNGWYIITRHSIEDLENGTTKIKGMILKGWSYFWEQLDLQNPYIPIFLTGIYLEGKMPILMSNGNKLTMVDENTCLLSETKLDTKYIDSQLQRYLLKCFEKQAEDNKGWYYFLYREEPNYRFSELIRKPLSQCITCFASVYGSIIWFFFSWVFFDEINSLMLVFGGSVIFCISLSFVNTFVMERLKTRF